MASGAKYDRYVEGGLMIRRLYDTRQDLFFLGNIVRLLQENQVKMLADQTIRDGWSAAPLVAVPTARWHIGSGRDFNALAVNIIYTSKNIYRGLSMSRRIDASLLTTVEQGDDAADVFRRADSYNAVWAEILIAFFLLGKQELCWDAAANQFTEHGIEDPQVTGGALVNSANLPGIQRPMGFLPTISFAFTVSPRLNQNKLA